MSSQRFVFGAIGLVTVLAAISVCAAQGGESVLALPGLSEPLCIQIETPKGQDIAAGSQLTLVEAGHPDNRPIVQAVPLVNAEGLPAEGKAALVATIAPRQTRGEGSPFQAHDLREANDGDRVETHGPERQVDSGR